MSKFYVNKLLLGPNPKYVLQGLQLTVTPVTVTLRIYSESFGISQTMYFFNTGIWEISKLSV